MHSRCCDVRSHALPACVSLFVFVIADALSVLLQCFVGSVFKTVRLILSVLNFQMYLCMKFVLKNVCLNFVFMCVLRFVAVVLF